MCAFDQQQNSLRRGIDSRPSGDNSNTTVTTFEGISASSTTGELNAAYYTISC